MTKRIYTESVKKWAKGLGISGGTLIGLIFLYLFAIGAISNVSYSEDMVCAGTELDPCYAYLNFTANEDIFLYKTNYDPWGRNTPFNFDPNVKSWKIERKWGSGWREINMTKGCTGSWCGCSWCNKDNPGEFAYAFRKDKDYQIRLTAFKNNPNESIKWGAFSGVDEIDPVWMGVTKDNVFRKLIENKVEGFTGIAIYEVNSPIKIKNPEKYFEYSFRKVKGDVRDYTIYVQKNVSKIGQKINGSICEEAIINKTKHKVCRDTYENYTYFKLEWVKNGEIEEGMNLVKLEAELTPSKEISIDWIPSITFDKKLIGTAKNINLKQSNWAWWNYSYNYSRKVLNHTSLNLILPINQSDIDANSNPEWFYSLNGSIYYNSDTDWAFTNGTSEICAFETKNKKVSCSNPPNGLIAYYPLDDSSGGAWEIVNESQNNGTFNGGYSQDGVVNTAFYFDGSDDAVTIPNSATWNIANESFSTTLWVYPQKYGSGGPTRQLWVGTRDRNGNLDGWSLGWSNDDTNFLISIMNGTYDEGILFPHGMSLDTWYFVALTFNNTNDNVTIYKNGVLLNTTTLQHVSFASANTNENLYLGWTASGGNNGYTHFKGKLDDVRIYNKTLSASEIKTIYDKTKNANVYFDAEESQSSFSPNQPILNYPLNGSTQIESNPTLNVTVSDPNSQYLNVSFIDNSDHSVICQNNSVLNGSNVLCVWNNLSDETTYFWYVNVTDGDFIIKSNIWNFLIDVSPPRIKYTIGTENNDTSFSRRWIFINITASDINNDTLVYNLYNSTRNLINRTTTDYTIQEINFTNLDDGIYWYKVDANDSGGNINSTEFRKIELDAINPVVSITYPIKDKVNYKVYNQLNYTINEVHPDKCWYSNDSGLHNYSVQTAGINFTGVIYSVGINNITVYCNDTFGHQGSDNLTFTYSLLPKLNIDNSSLELGTNITLNITLNDSSNYETMYLDIGHGAFGDNYLTITNSTTFNLSINSFIKETFSDGSLFKIFNFSSFSVNDSGFLIPAHQYDEVNNFSFNISSNDAIKFLTFYGCNSTSIDRAYFGYLKGKDILVNQSVSSDGSLFRNYENLTFLDGGDSLVYFYLDDNAKIKNILMNVSGDTYGLDYNDYFVGDNYTNINQSETDGEMWYDTILPKVFSTKTYVYDDFEDGKINQTLWINGTPASGSGWYVGTSETGGVLRLRWYSDNGGNLVSGSTRTYARLIRGETSKNITFSIYAFLHEENVDDYGSGKTVGIYVNEQPIWELHRPQMDYPEGHQDANASLDFKIIALNATHTKVIINGTEDSSNTDGYSKKIVYLNNETIYNTPITYIAFESRGSKGSDDPYAEHILDVKWINATFSKRNYTIIVSKPIFTPTANISSVDDVFFNISGAEGESSAIYLSPDGGQHWESVTNNQPHTFVNSGNKLVWLMITAIQQPDNYFTTTFLRGVEIKINSSEPENLSFDFGNDGIFEYNYTGVLNSTNSPILINLTSANLTNSFIESRQIYNHTYVIPLKVKSQTKGLVNLHHFNITYDPNPIFLNTGFIQDYLNNYGQNYTNFTIPVGGQNGSVNISQINYDYAGGNYTVKLTLHNSDYSFKIIRYLYYYYSRWDYAVIPRFINFIEFIPRSPTEKNVPAYGQKEDTPILNITNYGYGGKKANLSVYLNDTENTHCVNITLSFSNNKSKGYKLNKSWINLNKSLDYLESTNIWLWADYSCNYTNWRLFKPYLYFRQCANNTLCSEDIL